MARDIFHAAVRQALIHDGWTITADPYSLTIEDTPLQIDLGAERLVAAAKENHKIAVEIKSFIGSSAISEFHTALGQYLNYRIALSEKDPERQLFLAVPQDTYQTFFQKNFPKLVITEFKLAILVYDPEQESIEQWIP
jgi:hypothetical protein